MKRYENLALLVVTLLGAVAFVAFLAAAVQR